MSTPEHPATPPPAPQSKLGAALVAEAEALKNDLEQARELAAEYQRQLASKTNDYGVLNRLLQKTVDDFTQMQATVTELRQERHRLANEVMRGVAIERQLRSVSEERNRLVQELYELRRKTDSPEWLEKRLRELRPSAAEHQNTPAADQAKKPAEKPSREVAGADNRERINLSFDQLSGLDDISFSS